MANLKYLGVPVYMNGRNYFIPSLSTRDFRANYAAMIAPPPEGVDALASFQRFLPIIGLAVRRNYPEVTDEQLEEWLDLHTFKLAMLAVQASSGLTPVSQGEDWPAESRPVPHLVN